MLPEAVAASVMQSSTPGGRPCRVRPWLVIREISFPRFQSLHHATLSLHALALFVRRRPGPNRRTRDKSQRPPKPQRPICIAQLSSVELLEQSAHGLRPNGEEKLITSITTSILRRS